VAPGGGTGPGARHRRTGHLKILRDASTEVRPREVNLGLWFRDAFPSSVRSYQALTFYPALAYGLDNNRIGGVKFIRVRNRGPSGIVYSIKVGCGRTKQNRHSTWGGQFGKIADPKFHARKITRQPQASKEKSSAMNSSQLPTMQMVHPENRSLWIREIAAKISTVLPHGSAQCAWAQGVAYSLENRVTQQRRQAIHEP
jgi:hypothetical protein